MERRLLLSLARQLLSLPTAPYHEPIVRATVARRAAAQQWRGVERPMRVLRQKVRRIERKAPRQLTNT
jgi:hypothetical protein